MSLTSFSSGPIGGMISKLSSGESLSLIVGAGASVEAGLPTWNGLVRELLERAASETLKLGSADERSAWIDLVLVAESPLGAAAIAEAVAGDQLDAWIPEALYGDDPSAYRPGPIATQIARFRGAFGPHLKILTTNYDDLIEEALVAANPTVEAVPFTGPPAQQKPTDSSHQRVIHLHGYLPRTGTREGQTVLSERHYQELAQQDWQSSSVGEALMSGPCVFIGSSLTDPNLLRYLYKHGTSGRADLYALFTRQDAYPEGTSRAVIDAREASLVERWRSTGVEIIFVDHYAEIAQALSEVVLSKRDGPQYVPLPTRLSAWRRELGRSVLFDADADAFPAAQETLHDALRDVLTTALQTAGEVDSSDADPDEVIAATLWLVDESGETLTNWATTDRVHRDLRTVDPVPIDEFSSWVAVRAFTRGAALAEPHSLYASRWKYIRGMPLTIPGLELPAGVITVASMHDEASTFLNAMEPATAAAFDETMQQLVLDIVRPDVHND